MQKLVVAVVATSVVAGAFLAGVAVGKVPPPQPKFTAAEEVKWDDLSGLKIGTLAGDYKKGAYGALVRVPAGYTSQLHSHTGAYEAVEINGTSSHWMRGEDGTKAKKMTPGSYWSIPAKMEHVSSCAAGADCVMFISQKVKYDALPAKDAPAVAGGSATAATGSAATKPAATATGSGATSPKTAGTGAGSAALKATGTGAGSAAPKATGTSAGAATKPSGTGAAGAGSGSQTTPKK